MDPGFPGPEGSLMRSLFGNNLCQNERIREIGVCRLPRSATDIPLIWAK